MSKLSFSLIRSNTSTCNTPQKTELSRKGSVHHPADVAETQSFAGASAPDGSTFCDSYDMATLRDRSQHIANSSFAHNKSMRRLFPVTDSFNQSSDFNSSSVRHHPSDSSPVCATTAEESSTIKNACQRRNSSADQRNQRNSNVFTSTPIRNANKIKDDQGNATPFPLLGKARRGPSLVSTPLNHTFPQRHETAATTTTTMTNPYLLMMNNAEQPPQQQPDNGYRKQANRTISLGEFMGRPKCAIQFPQLGHNNNNNYANNRRKGQSQQPHLDSPLDSSPGSSSIAAATTRPVDTGDDISNNQRLAATTTTKKQKPKRRVVPISLSTSTTAGGRYKKSTSPSTTVNAAWAPISPSKGRCGNSGVGGNCMENGFGTEFMNSPFRTANNLLDVQGEEQDYQAPHELNERRLLREEKEAIKTDFEEEANRGPGNLRNAVAHLLSTTTNTRKLDIAMSEESSQVEPKLSFKHLVRALSDKKKLDVCAELYSTILNFNLTMNLLSELTFLLTIINVVGLANTTSGGGNAASVLATRMRRLSVGEAVGEIDAEPTTTMVAVDFEVLFRAPLNCIYLAVEVLNKQRVKLLALLDAKTLRLLIENEKLGVLSAGLITYLQDVYRLKSELEQRYRSEYDGFRAGASLTNDEHGVAKPPMGQQSVFYQVDDDTRDHFPTQNEFIAFKKQRDLFYVILRTWEEKHLHVRWNFEEQLGSKIRYLFVLMPHPINMAHLAKLFTRQLLVCCNHWNNVEQSAAQTELLERFANVDLSRLSKLEQRLVTPGNSSAELLFPGIQVFFREFIVVAESNPAFVEQLKIALLAELLALNDSTYEILNVTTTAGPIKGVPFNEIVVSPVSMSIMRVLAKFLGFVISQPFHYEGNQNKTVDNKQVELRNLQLPQFDVVAVLETALQKDKLLITVPWMVQYLAMLDAVTLQLDYYRKLLQTLYGIYVDLPYQKMSPASSVVLSLCLGWLFERANVSATSWYYLMGQSGVTRDISRLPPAGAVNLYDRKTMTGMLHPLLEKILPVACPFLADFRLTILPPLRHNQKLVSRSTGRYRHIATTQLPFSSPKDAAIGQNIVPQNGLIPDSQGRLIEAFLQSQSPSLRKIVDFLIERVSSTTIKDFQIQHFLLIKKDAQSAAKEIKLTEKKAVISCLMNIYTKSLEELTLQWTNTVPKAIETKVKQCIGALLPVETIIAVRETCTDIVIRMCLGKTNDWRTVNFNHIDIFSKDVEGEAVKIIKTRETASETTDDKMVISIEHTFPSSIYNELLLAVHLTSMYPEKMTRDTLESLLDKLQSCFTFNSFSNATLRSFVVILNNLVMLNIARNPDIVVGVLDKLVHLFRIIRDTNQLCESPKLESSRDRNLSSSPKYIFPGSILPRCIIFYFDPNKSFNVLVAYLSALIDLDLLSLNTLNENLVALLRFDWPGETARTLSLLTAAIRDLKASAENDEDKSQLLLGALSNLTAHIEDFNDLDDD